ncbi:MAG: GNAT family N-acetyltransferase [Spirochaetes bacterium]|nr:GNAT family N-acetyltransferase [Spirochaetota bacterium]
MKYSIIEAHIEKDRDNIVAIKRRNLKNSSDSTFIWKYKDNACGNVYNLLAKDDNGNAVGMTSLFPRRFYLNGQAVSAAVAGDFAVDKKHRAFGPALNLQKTSLSNMKNCGFSFIYALPNKFSAPVMLRAGYIEIGKMQRFVRLLKAKNSLKKYIKNFLLLNLTSMIIDSLLKLFSKENRYRKYSHLKVEHLGFFDERIDCLWGEVFRNFKIVGERTSVFLNWRYQQSSTDSYKIFTVEKNDKKIIGYVVYYIANDVFYIVDMLSADIEKSTDILIGKFIIYAQKKAAHAISIVYFGNVQVERKLKEFGFFSRHDERKVLFNGKEWLNNVNLKSENNWYLLGGDEDAI